MFSSMNPDTAFPGLTKFARADTPPAAALGAARRTAEAVPNAVLQAPRKVTRTALDVTDSAAKFASRLFE